MKSGMDAVMAKRIVLTQVGLVEALKNLGITYTSRMRIHKDGRDFIGFECNLKSLQGDDFLKIFPQAVFLCNPSSVEPNLNIRVVAFPRKTQLYMLK